MRRSAQLDALLEGRDRGADRALWSGHLGKSRSTCSGSQVTARKIDGMPAGPLRMLDSVRLDALADLVQLRETANTLARRRRARRSRCSDRAGRARLRHRDQHQRSCRGPGRSPPTVSAPSGAATKEAEQIYGKSDLMIVVGLAAARATRHRTIRCGCRACQGIDADPGAGWPQLSGRTLHRRSSARLALEGLLARLPEKLASDPSFLADIGAARKSGELALGKALGPYAPLADALSRRVGRDRHPWVRDVTVSNSTIGNR